jgi:hypothetical protein
MSILNRDKLEVYIKEVAFMISCFPRLDPRDYVREKTPSRLFRALERNNFQVDAAVAEVVALIVKDEKFMDLLQSYLRATVEEEYEDQVEDLKIDFFQFTINFIGLHTVFTMHGDTVSMFQNKFFQNVFN